MRISWRWAVAGLLGLQALLSGASAWAGPADSSKSLAPEIEPEAKRDLLHFEVSYVGDADFHDSKLGSLDVVEYGFDAAHRVLIGAKDWFLRLGVAYERRDFGLSRAPVPSHLQGISAIIAIEYLPGGQTGFFIQSNPGVYFANEVSAGAFDAPTTIAMAYPLADNVFLVAGVNVSLLREYPVIPALGVRWKISDQWDLKLYLPEPRLVYSPSGTVSFWAGAGWIGGNYRSDRRELEPKKLSNAVVNYREIRVGAGATWKLTSITTFELSGGYALDREFDYFRAGENYKLDNAPYLDCRLALEF